MAARERRRRHPGGRGRRGGAPNAIEARRALAQARVTIEEHERENAELQERLETTRRRAEEARSDLEAARAEAAAARSELGERRSSGRGAARIRRARGAAVTRQAQAEEVAVRGDDRGLRSRRDELQRELAELQECGRSASARPRRSRASATRCRRS